MNTEEMSLGNFLWAHRMGEDISQVEFANFLGISKQRLCDLEKNRSNVSVKFCIELAQKLDLPPTLIVKLAFEYQFKKEGLDLKIQSNHE